MTKVRVDPTVLGRVQRALEGRCFDCHGKGQRKNLVDRMVQCPTCNGSGRVPELSICQVSMSAAVTVSKTIDALRELEDLRLAERVIGSEEPELWRAVARRKAI